MTDKLPKHKGYAEATKPAPTKMPPPATRRRANSAADLTSQAIINMRPPRAEVEKALTERDISAAVAVTTLPVALDGRRSLVVPLTLETARAKFIAAAEEIEDLAHAEFMLANCPVPNAEGTMDLVTQNLERMRQLPGLLNILPFFDSVVGGSIGVLAQVWVDSNYARHDPATRDEALQLKVAQARSAVYAVLAEHLGNL